MFSQKSAHGFNPIQARETAIEGDNESDMAKDPSYVQTYQNHTIRATERGFIVPEISPYTAHKTLELAKKAIRDLRKSFGRNARTA